MMMTNRIVEILGEETVKVVVDACTSAFASAQRHGDLVEGMEAARELMLQMVCAAVMTPIVGASERAEEFGTRLNTVIAEVVGDTPRLPLAA